MRHHAVLIVDDDPDIRQSLCEVLQDEGFETHCLANGSEALAELHREHALGEAPCVVLCDLMMPVMNGYEFIARAKADPTLKEVPVVVVSAMGRAEDVQPADGFLPKPLDLESLIAKVGEFCRGVGC